MVGQSKLTRWKCDGCIHWYGCVMTAIALGNKVNASGGVSQWEPGECLFGVLWQWYRLVQILLMCLLLSWEDSTSRQHQPNVGNPSAYSSPVCGRELGCRVHLAGRKTKRSFFLPVALWVGSSESLSLILSFEGIKQAALMGGNAALKILPFVRKAFLLLLLGQVQLEKESVFKAPSQMFFLAASRTKEWKWDEGNLEALSLVCRWALTGLGVSSCYVLPRKAAAFTVLFFFFFFFSS